MLAQYVLADLARNPRRTLSTVVGVTLGVGLFCGVLFFVDGLSASMTQRAVAPLAIDMQRIVTQPTGATLSMTQTIEPTGPIAAGDQATVVLDVANVGEIEVNDVVVRSRPTGHLVVVPGSALVDGTPIEPGADNPFSRGAGQAGYNLGTLAPDAAHRLEYQIEATAPTEVGATSVASTYSSREQLNPVPAGLSAAVDLRVLARHLSALDGVAAAEPLSIADLGRDTLAFEGAEIHGPVKIFGFDADYALHDPTIDIVDGSLSLDGAVVSAEVATELNLAIGDNLTLTLPDDSSAEMVITGVADLSRARSLFSSRRGGDLETFVYTSSSVAVSPTVFAELVQPAFDRAASARNGRFKNPPIREVDVSLDRGRLDADPSSALTVTRRISEEIRAVEAGSGDYVLDNISNTLEVAEADAAVAKKLFVFLGVPGGLLAAMLAAYAGTVLADAQRREQAILRIRGAGRPDLLRMLALRTALLTAAGSVCGLISGYLLTAAILGRDALDRAGPSSLAVSALLGTLSGFCATGLALYLSGRRSINREINEDRAQLDQRSPLWRRARLDLVGIGAVLVTTLMAIRADAFAGTPGSVYFGRSVELNLALLTLPLLVWIAGGLLCARIVGSSLARTRPPSTEHLRRPLPSLYRRSIGRRPWPISNAALVITLIVALATSLSSFTSSYDAAKVEDARYANGADIRITPSPTADAPFAIRATSRFETDGIRAVTPVIYGPSNVVLRSARTSDPANLAAVDPRTYPSVVDLPQISRSVQSLEGDPTAVLLSADMASFLKVEVGDRLDALLARATDTQAEVQLHVIGTYQRLPGFPDGADALMAIGAYVDAIPTKNPDFFLAATDGTDDEGLQSAVDALGELARGGQVTLDTRATTLVSDQSSIAALNIAGLVDLDATFSLAMAVVTIAIFVFGLLLQRRREYVTLRAQGLEPGTIRLLIVLEAATAALAGSIAGVVVGISMGAYFVAVLRPLFVLTPTYRTSAGALILPVVLVAAATLVATLAASHLVGRLEPTELLRDD